MTFAPVVPLGGYAGWKVLQATLDTQQARFAEDPAQSRDRAYFKENIGAITSAEELVSDYRLLRVALGAFGLDDDLPNRAFVEKVLSDGVTDDDALSNKLADKTYRKFSEAFGFGSILPPLTQGPGFADKILARFDQQAFEVAVGEQDTDMRLALEATRELPEIAAADTSDATAWLTVLGDTALRQVFETAFSLPSTIGSVDLDQQLEAFRKGAERVLGTSEFSVLQDPAAVEDLVHAFTLKSQLAAGPSAFTRGASAVTLLQNLV
ncbi:hypothetical protein A8B78_05050 [Jannaschia sp. EhC01]|nr:hypothetical protein A8B78_05050 [Jannaschia sp. EhC01]